MAWCWQARQSEPKLAQQPPLERAKIPVPPAWQPGLSGWLAWRPLVRWPVWLLQAWRRLASSRLVLQPAWQQVLLRVLPQAWRLVLLQPV
ncbi:hypothetical protein JM49_01375 [Pseudomonas chlororaphis subsp. aurantiaca]|nr:hypothetical protein JM49_01375 [Pseudomonas chlororaphis subsp. aurantiaca]